MYSADEEGFVCAFGTCRRELKILEAVEGLVMRCREM